MRRGCKILAELMLSIFKQQGTQPHLRAALPHVLPELVPAIGKPLNNHLQSLYGRNSMTTQDGEGLNGAAVPNGPRYECSSPGKFGFGKLQSVPSMLRHMFQVINV